MDGSCVVWKHSSLITVIWAAPDLIDSGDVVSCGGSDLGLVPAGRASAPGCGNIHIGVAARNALAQVRGRACSCKCSFLPRALSAAAADAGSSNVWSTSTSAGEQHHWLGCDFVVCDQAHHQCGCSCS